MKSAIRLMKLVWFVCLFSISYGTYSQMPPFWTIQFDSKVLWHEVTPLGNLLVCTKKALFGLNPETGDIIWTQTSLGNMPHSAYKPIERTPFVSIEWKGIKILNPFTGQVIFNSIEAGIDKIDLRHFLYSVDGVLITGKTGGGGWEHKKKAVVVLIDMSSGKVKWRIEVGINGVIAVHEISADEILLVTLFKLLKINASNGQIIWEKMIHKGLNRVPKFLAFMAEQAARRSEIDIRFYHNPGSANFIIGYLSTEEINSDPREGPEKITYSNIYNAYKFRDGSIVWDTPLVMKGRLSQVILNEKGLIILPDGGDKTKINLVDYQTGKGQWGKKGKGIKVKGGIFDYMETEVGILIFTQTSGHDYVNLLDPETGMVKFEKPVKVKGRVLGSELWDNGLLVVTDEQVNLLDVNSGAFIFSKSIPILPGLVTGNQDKLYVFSTREQGLVEIIKNSTTIRTLSKDQIKFEGNENPEILEIRDRGIAILSDQNLALVGYDGQIIHKSYYPAPREPGWKRALLYALAVTAAYESAVSTVKSVNYYTVADHTYDLDEAMVNQALGRYYGEWASLGANLASGAFSIASARLKATGQSWDFVYMVTKTDQGHALIKVDKDTGQVIKKLDLGNDRKPNYAVDYITHMVYYQNGQQSLHAYHF